MSYVIVGGTTGIGRAVAEKLKSQHTVYTLSRRQEANFSCDVCDFGEDLPKIDEAIEGLMYCPGSINLKPFSKLSFEDYRSEWEVNFLGAVRIIHHFLPQLKKAKQSSVLLMSTIAVRQGMAYHASTASAKGAVEALMRSLAAEFAPAIRFNALAPSLTNTQLAQHLLDSETKQEHAAKRHPLQRIGEIEDCAEAALFLLSEKSSWITGQTLAVDGGLSTLLRL